MDNFRQADSIRERLKQLRKDYKDSNYQDETIKELIRLEEEAFEELE